MDDLNERGRRALSRFRARRASGDSFLDRRTVLTAIAIAVLVISAAWAWEQGLLRRGFETQHQDLAGFSVYLHRQACPGPCPVYAVLVRGDGSVEFEGVENVATAGPGRALVDENHLRALVLEIDRAGFDRVVSDVMPGAATCERWTPGLAPFQLGVTRDGTTRAVTVYPACDPGAPELVDLARAVDALAGTARWVNASPAR